MDAIARATNKTELRNITKTTGVNGIAAYNDLLQLYERSGLCIELASFYKLDLMHIVHNIHANFFELLSGAWKSKKYKGSYSFYRDLPFEFVFRIFTFRLLLQCLWKTSQ
jgi:hypothetical protein